MTAEIALLNKMAVTLAADSAVTIGTASAPKVYNSADKIFEATNHDPIGIMVYNVPEIHGIPVEAIVKLYRDRYCTSHAKTVFEFADAFLRHVGTITAPPNVIKANIFADLYGKLEDVRSKYVAVVDQVLDTLEDPASREEMLAAFDAGRHDVLDTAIKELESAPTMEWADGLDVKDVFNFHKDAITETIDEMFSGGHFTDDLREKVNQIASLWLLKSQARDRVTGLVFAGYGQDEIFPSLVAYEIFGFVAGRLKSVRTTKFDVDRSLSPIAAVIPFAQQDMVDRFVYGIDNEFLSIANQFLMGSFAALRSNLSEALRDTAPDAEAAAIEAINAIQSEFNNVVVPQHLSRLRSQLSDIVQSMPKQELAALSESLVNITSLKRKFSADPESVGGPVDVAMITRAEGFVWVKRKHFFDPGLNPRYFARKYGVLGRPAGASDTGGEKV